MSGLKFSHRVGILVAMFVVSVAGMMMVAPMVFACILQGAEEE